MKHRLNYLALAIGLCLAAATAFSVYSTVDFYASSVVDTAKVIRLNHGGHHPQIAFDAKSGQHYELPASSWWSVSVGQPVQIRYTPDDPRVSVDIDSAFDIWWCSGLLSVLSVIFLVTGLRGDPFDRVGIR